MSRSKRATAANDHEGPSLYVLPVGESSLLATERTLLGALILDHTQIEAVAALDPDDLAYVAHRALLRLLRRMAASSIAWDLTLLLDRLQSDPAELEACGGDIGLISDYASGAPDTHLLDHYVGAIQDAAARNRLRRLASWASETLLAASTSQDPDYAHAVDQIVGRLRGALPTRTRPATQTGPEDLVWRQLSLTEKMTPRATLSNIYTVLRDDSRWKSLRLNLLGSNLESGGRPREHEAHFIADTARWLATHYDIEASSSVLQGAILAAAQERAYHPVKEYLEGLHWDGTPHIAQMLQDILGVKPTALYQAYMRRFLIGSVARACQPGVKFDTALIFVGAQGAKKSTFFARLFGQRWFGDSPIPIGDKDAFIQLRTVWCYEAAEMEDLSKKTAEAIKQFLSGSTDVYRAPYDREARHHARHSVMVGTTNRPEFLSDETGHRRFWPITIPEHHDIRIDLVDAWRDQLWAEAYAAWKAGETFWIERSENTDLARDEDVARYQVEHPWTPLIESWLLTAPRRFKTSNLFAGALKLDPSQYTQPTAGIVTKILTKLGYYQHIKKVHGKSDRSWVAPDYQPEEDPRPSGGYVVDEDRGFPN